MLYLVLLKMIKKGSVDGLAEKIDIFFAAGKITEEQYAELSSMLEKKEA